MEERGDDGYIELSIAIVRTAVTDYKKACNYLDKYGDSRAGTDRHIRMTSMKESCVRFFRGKWFKTLCDVDGEYFLREIPKSNKRRVIRGKRLL